MNGRYCRISASLVVFAAAALLAGCERPPVEQVQRGYRGLAMGLVYNPRLEAASSLANQAPAATMPEPQAGGPLARNVYKNIQVLDDLNVAQLTRLMLAMTQWVAPAGQSCTYCHSADLASDDNYRKVVARKMLLMVRDINSNWKTHVGATGVTCYTCHRGNDVPANVWYTAPPGAHDAAMVGNRAGQNAPAGSVGLASLPNDPFSAFLASEPSDIRVVSTTALPEGSRKSVKQTEWTYGLMMHMSEALGVNCTYCHNSRSFTSWDSSTPQRATAWYGIRMVRAANTGFLTPLTPTFPDDRKGPLGDVAKINCQTCHQGVYKPLYGVSMLKDYPELAGHVEVSGEAPVAPASGSATQ
jgi:photosynthetic reaction center cytochrome c subunit